MFYTIQVFNKVTDQDQHIVALIPNQVIIQYDSTVY